MASRSKNNYLLAGILIVLGILFLLNNIGFASLDLTIGTWWPLILIILGLQQLFASRFTNLFSWFLIFVGVSLQLHQLGLIDSVQLKLCWPLLLIFLGLVLLFGFGRSNKLLVETSPQRLVDIMAIFGGIERQITSPSFLGGFTMALFGGINLDLTGSQLAEGVQVLNIRAFFGRVELILPESWSVEIRGVPFFGGIEDKRNKLIKPEGEADSKLLINSLVAFGGIDIKN